MLPELTPRWELLIVDDGSTDATPEVIQELIRPYPQADVIHHSAERGDTACFRAGMQRMRSDVLLLRAESCDLDLAGLDKMWKKISSHDLIVARSHGDAAPGRQPARSLRQGNREDRSRPSIADDSPSRDRKLDHGPQPARLAIVSGS